jgi:predicted secreted protein
MTKAIEEEIMKAMKKDYNRGYKERNNEGKTMTEAMTKTMKKDYDEGYRERNNEGYEERL